MIKNSRWLLLAMLVMGAILWWVLAGVGQKGTAGDASSPSRKGNLAGAASGTTAGRESSRHKTGEVEKKLATPLEKKVTQQERKVEERRMVLPALAKAKGPVFMNVDGTPPPAESPEETAKKAQAAQDYDDARRAYLAERVVLEELKLELAEEQKNAKPDAGVR